MNAPLSSRVSGAPLAQPSGLSRLHLVLRLALRDLRGGLRGFGIFLACIALGVAAIVGVGSVARGLGDGLASQGRTILGGDVSFSIIHEPLSADQVAFFTQRGRVSTIATQRGMVRKEDGASSLVEIKAVDGHYPPAGALILDPPGAAADQLARKDGVFGAMADPGLFSRLDIKPGDRLMLGEIAIEMRAQIVKEPDTLADGVGFAPRLMLSQEALMASGLVQPGSLTRWHYRVSLPEDVRGQPQDEAAVQRLIDEANRAWPDAGWQVRARNNVSPRFSQNIERFSQFLTLVGLTALVVGGVGIANAVAGFVDRKRASLATLKSLGATGGGVFAIALGEVMLIALVGIAIGLAIGAAIPFAVAGFLGALLPIPLQASLYPQELLLGLLYGLLTALSFALLPLGRVHDIPVSALFRDTVAGGRSWPRRRYLVLLALSAGALMGAAILFSYDRRLALIYIGATIAAFILLRGVALGVMAIARRLPRPRNTELRLALSNIHRPGALTPSVVLSLGLGLALMVALTLIDSNIRNQIEQGQPGRTPSFFFMDVRSADADSFESFLKGKAPEADIERVPMMRGRVVRLNDTRAENAKAAENAAWVLEGDRGITYARDLPAGSKLTAGTWWEQDYNGPPLVSVEREIADGLGLTIGDRVTVNVLGRNLTATIANLREVDWRTFGINFVFVFSPNTFAGAPHTVLATATFPDGGDAARELPLLKEIGQAWPTVTSVRVRDALDAVSEIVNQLSVAIRGASGIAILSSVLVLAGALAAGQRARIYDAVVLKTLGATRRSLLGAFLAEYAIIGFATAIFGLVAGSLAAWGIGTGVMKLPFTLDWRAALIAAGGALLLTVALGLIGTWRILGEKPARHLRSL